MPCDLHFFWHHLDLSTQADTLNDLQTTLSNPSFESTTPMSLFITLFLQCYSHAQKSSIARENKPKDRYCMTLLNEVPGRVNSIKIESEIVVARSWGQGGMKS